MTSEIEPKYRRYLAELGGIIGERALEAKRLSDKEAEETPEKSFQAGRLLAYYSAVSCIQQDAEAMGIPLEETSLGHIVPDRDL